jgi:hypothetical protein
MQDFELGSTFRPTEASGHLQLDRYEAAYQDLFNEVLEDGVITEEERGRLDRAAERLGLDRARLDALENAVRGAYEAHHGQSVLDASRMFAPRSTLAAPAPDFVPTVHPPRAPIVSVEGAAEELAALRTRVSYLEERVRDLTRELEEARAQVAYEVDFSDLDAPVPSAMLEAPEALHRRLRHDPRDVATLKQMFVAYDGQRDRQWCTALAIAYLGEAEPRHAELLAAHGGGGLIQPKAAVDAVAWKRLICHPDDEAITSDILALIVSAILLAHSGALRQAGQLPAIDPQKRLDPATSTVQAARCFAWAGQALGMAAPMLYASPEADTLTRMIPTVPPTCALGKRALSGRTAQELAFVAGRELAYYRPERFIRLLVPDVVQLQDLFLAALAIGNPGLPLNAEVRARVKPISAAVEPLLDSVEVDQLRAAYRRFVEQGGVANLQRWAAAADLSAIRAGFVLAADLHTAERMLVEGGARDARQSMDDLLVFATSDRYAKLREQMGIALS